MKNLISVCGIIAFAIIATACGSSRETTTIRRETVQTVPAAPVIERQTTETIETEEDDD